MNMTARDTDSLVRRTASLSPCLSLRESLLISRSRHADVYRCRASVAGMHGSCSYSLKVLHADEDSLRRQAALLKRLSRASVNKCGRLPLPPIVSLGCMPADLRRDAQTTLYVVTPWVEGETLASLVKRAARSQRPLSLDSALLLLRSLAANIEALGQLEDGSHLVHGDIKPSNIIVSENRQTMLIDTDTAFFLNDAGPSISFGTFGYAAPETILRGQGCCGVGEPEAADIFSFGVVAHEMLAGRWPYPFRRGLSNTLRFWRDYLNNLDGLQIDGAIPGDIRSVIMSCLSLDPSLRPTAASVAESMGRLAEAHRGSGERCCTSESEGPVPATVL